MTNHQLSIKLILILAATFLLAPIAHGREPIPQDGLHGLGTVHYYRVEVQQPARLYHIYVAVPEVEAGAGKLPAVYLLDGGTTFPLLTGYQRYLSLGDETPPVLTVGISYGAATFKDGNYRSTDFTAPSAEYDFWGGAQRFRQILREQIIPLVENQHRADPDKRILFGHSLGGQFVIDTALQDPGLFSGLIASNPALHRNLEHFTNAAIVQTANGLQPRLLVSSAEDDAPRFRGPAKQWIDFWQGRNLPLALKVIEPAGHNHMSSVPLAFRHGLRWVLEGTQASSASP